MQREVDLRDSPRVVLGQLRKTKLLDPYFAWSGDAHVLACGIGTELVLDAGVLRVRDSSGATLDSCRTTDPFTDARRLLDKHVSGPFRAFGYFGFGLTSYRYTVTKLARRELHLFVPRLLATVGTTVLRLEGDEEAVDLATKALEPRVDETRKAVSLDFEPVVKQGRDDYVGAIRTIREHIAQGKVEKVVLARHISIPAYSLDEAATFFETTTLAAARRFAFQLDGVRGVGACPELLLVADAAGEIVTNPLAGTRPRGKTEQEDEELRRELLSDPKELSEHAQSIRAAYEEIRSVVSPESLRVVDFMQLKRYPFTQHLSSRAAGRLATGQTTWDALRAVFPAVTVTGVQKPDALRLIDALEPTPRGVYGGAVGWVSSDGSMDLGIAIRSAFDYGHGPVLSAGAGIVRDSDAAFEFEESMQKMRTIASRMRVLPSSRA